MKTRVLIITVILCLCLTGCTFESYEPYIKSDSEIVSIYNENKSGFQDITEFVLMLGDESIVISHTDYYPALSNDENISGLYISDLKGEYENYSSETIESFMQETGVKGISVSHDYGEGLVEFDMGAGNFFRGIYYNPTDRPLYIAKPDAELKKDGDGFSFKEDGTDYFTKRISEDFFYYQLNN